MEESDQERPEGEDTPEGWASRWTQEMAASAEELEAWHSSAERAVAAYLDDRPRAGQRLNLFSANVNTQEAMLFGNIPKVDAERRFRDSTDEDARVAALILDRMLNGDLERDEESYPRALDSSLNDWLRVGFGGYRLRYVRETEQTEPQEAKIDEQGVELAPAVPAGEQILNEEVETDYFYWKDQAWSPARTFAEVRWWGFRSLLSQSSAEKKFGVRLPLRGEQKDTGGKDTKDPKTPWARAEVWEIWDKENECLWFWCKGYQKVLVPAELKADANANGSIPDPLGIRGFWPFPEPVMSNLTTSKLIPRPDYAMSRDQYESINDLTTRIGLLRDVVKAAGVFDQSVGELGQILEGSDNKLVPATNYAALAEKGGIAACIAWLPLADIVAALDKLRDVRNEEINLHFQTSGVSDIMRGEATAPGTTATEQAIKAKFASVRQDKAQKRFARFAGDGQRIRAEIICKHFSDETILARSNAQGLAQQDQQRVPAALKILRDQFHGFKIAVKPDSISLTDYAANKQEAMDVLETIGSFIQTIGPLAVQAPQITPMLLQLLQAFLAKVKGGEDVEGILDQAIEVAQQAASQPKPPDPMMQIRLQQEQGKIQTQQLKGQTEQVKAGAEKFRAKADVAQTQMEMQQSAAEHQQGMQRLEAETRADAMRVVAGMGGEA